MGFCFFNNVALAAQTLLNKGLASRILIVDWDIHHGNGTQHIFANDPNVLFISLHRHDHGKFYPISNDSGPSFVGGEGAMGKTINIGWNQAGMRDADYLHAFSRIIMPVAWQFNPDFVLVSAGFDAAEGDYIGDCKVTPRGYATMTQLLMGLAGGKLLLVLEGGYNVPVIAECAEACMRVLLGDPVPQCPTNSPPHQVSEAAFEAVAETIKYQSPFWSALRPKHQSINSAISVPGNSILEAFWLRHCQSYLDLMPLSISIDKENGTAPRDESGEVSSHTVYPLTVLAQKGIISPSSKNLVIVCHEQGVCLTQGSQSNCFRADQLQVLFPCEPLLAALHQRGDCSIIDITTPSKEWKLKQLSAGPSDEISFYRRVVDSIFNKIILSCRNDELSVFIVASGIMSYAFISYWDQHPSMPPSYLKGIAIVSPTLFLPVISTEKSLWYRDHSLVFAPTTRPLGSPIPTNPSYGRCVSSGVDDPTRFHNVLIDATELILEFIK